MAFRIGTYNTLNTSCRYEERKSLLRSNLLELSADLIGLQEINSRSVADLQFPDYTFLFAKGIRPSQVHPDPNFSIEGIGTLVKTSLEVKTQDSLFYDDDYKLAQKLTLEIGGVQLCYVNTHLNYLYGEVLRAAQISALLSWLAPEIQSDSRLIISGDFNFNPTSPLYEKMSQTFTSAYAKVHGEEPVITFPTGLFGEFSDVDKCEAVDFIWYRGLLEATTAERKGEHGDSNKRLYGSDHFSIFADFKILSSP